MTKCVILAGGLGTRLAVEVPNVPKCLAPIGNSPFLKLQLEMLSNFGLDEFILSLGHHADKIINELSSQWAKKYRIQYVVEQSPLGTGGSIKNTFNDHNINEAIVINGDSFINGNISDLLRPLNTSAGELTRIAVINVKNRDRFGGVELDQNNKVINFYEKGHISSGYVNAGIYRINKEVFLDAENAFSLEHLIFPRLVERQNLYAQVISGTFIDIGIPRDYRRFNNFVNR